MADTFGALAFPAPVAEEDDGRGITTHAAGDPCLDVLADFFRAVLIADVGDAWAQRAPAADEQPIVRRVFTHNPAECEFTEADLPALFIWRGGSPAFDQYQEDVQRNTETLTLWWVFPRAPQPDHQRVRDPLINAIGKACARAARRGRHPAWILSADGSADATAIKYYGFASTSTLTWSGADLDGAVGGGVVHAPRPVTILCLRDIGAYNTTDPVEVTGRLANGVEHTESFTIDDPDGGMTVTGIWNFASVTRIFVPAQPRDVGRIAVGYAASTEAALGSLVKRAAGLVSLSVCGAKKTSFRIQDDEGDQSGPFYAAEMAVVIEEHEAADIASFDSLGDTDGDGAFMTFINSEGDVMGTMQVPNEEI